MRVEEIYKKTDLLSKGAPLWLQFDTYRKNVIKGGTNENSKPTRRLANDIIADLHFTFRESKFNAGLGMNLSI